MKRFFVRTTYEIINPWRRWYWIITKTKSRGVKCLIVHQGKILLVRLAYAHRKWTIPGGGVKKRETYEAAARREIAEEVGIKLGAVQKIGDYVSTKQGKHDTVWCFFAEVDSPEFQTDELEIGAAGWFDPDHLPEPHTPTTPEIISMYRRSSK